ncbi:Protein trichome birefringence-like 19 [Camellia lanceoleosa]|uniref:Protein trichome birefringence-like 19 n=1 Tax=Camellia lanceoleosa TaxID=1840588 RepID=A0ACC0HYL7_9ERIC|nr:Protein trichome birefringence-like 19 [Camellia lanceoleosa]
MKVQANELPVMKNQTRRKTSPKIAPLVVLALFLLTIIPIYYPLLRYPTKNSLKPSSSSGISFLDPLCHDDLSQENGHCSHHDVEKSSLVTSREDLVTTDHGGDVETSSTTRENNVVTAHDRDVEKLLRNHDTKRDVETKGTMKDSDLVTAHDSDDDTVMETMPKKHNIVHDGDDTGVETLSRKQNPGRNVETKLSKSGLVPGHDGDDDTVVETLPKKQNRGTELETESNLRKSDAEELPNGDIDDMVVVTLQKKPNPSKEVKTKPILKQSDTDVEELDSGDMSAAAAAATTTITTPTPDKDVEEPEDVSEIPYGSQFKRYEYRNHSFTIEMFWSPYLVKTTQTDPTDPNQSRPFNLFLDEFDEQWTSKIEPFDYVIVSAGHWFFRPTMFYLEGRLAGCLYCPQSNIPHLTSYFSYRRAFRTAFRAINSLSNYKGLTFLRTFAPSHFEGGYWDKGGDCARKRPFRNHETRLEGYNLEFYSIQVQELKIAQRLGRRRGLKYRLFDVTQAMLLRPDGHPSKYGHWPQAKVSLANDCVHWCLPGPVDAWNDFFLELLKREGIDLV